MCLHRKTNQFKHNVRQLLGSSAPGQPTTTMIMEGLETLVAPSHHAFLLTESAAAAHFNVLSFDTCLQLKSAATSTSFANNNNNNNNNLFTINNNTSSSPGVNCSVNCMSTNNSSNNTDTNHPSHHHQHHHHTNHIERISNTEHQSHSISDAQTGDLNTPVTTSSDIPSFFGPNTIEPPHITGECLHLSTVTLSSDKSTEQFIFGKNTLSFVNANNSFALIRYK